MKNNTIKEKMAIINSMENWTFILAVCFLIGMFIAFGVFLLLWGVFALFLWTIFAILGVFGVSIGIPVSGLSLGILVGLIIVRGVAEIINNLK